MGRLIASRELAKLDAIVRVASRVGHLEIEALRDLKKRLVDYTLVEDSAAAKSIGSAVTHLAEDIKLKNGHAVFETLNDKSASKVIADIRRGDLHDMIMLVDAKSAIKLSDNSKRLISEYIQSSFPDHSLSKLDKVNEVVRESLGKRLYSMRESKKLTLGDKEVLRKALDRVKKEGAGGHTSVKTLFFGVVAVASVPGFIAYYESTKNVYAGMFRVYNVNGTTKACKVPECSCAHGQTTHNSTSSVIECTLKPSGISPNTCAGWQASEGSNCRSWSPEADSNSKQYLSRHNFVEATDVYQCRDVPSIGDYVAGVAGAAGADLSYMLTSTFQYIFTIFKYLSIVGFAVLLVFLVIKFAPSSGGRDHGEEIKHLIDNEHHQHHRHEHDDEHDKTTWSDNHLWWPHSRDERNVRVIETPRAPPPGKLPPIRDE